MGKVTVKKTAETKLKISRKRLYAKKAYREKANRYTSSFWAGQEKNKPLKLLRGTGGNDAEKKQGAPYRKRKRGRRVSLAGVQASVEGSNGGGKEKSSAGRRESQYKKTKFGGELIAKRRIREHKAWVGCQICSLKGGTIPTLNGGKGEKKSRKRRSLRGQRKSPPAKKRFGQPEADAKGTKQPRGGAGRLGKEKTFLRGAETHVGTHFSQTFYR